MAWVCESVKERNKVYVRLRVSESMSFVPIEAKDGKFQNPGNVLHQFFFKLHVNLQLSEF